jgi:hypothetical protein
MKGYSVVKVNPNIPIHRCLECHEVFERDTTRGQPPKYCPGCRLPVKRRNDRDRIRDIRKGEGVKQPPCCAELGRGKRCPQHQQWRYFKRTFQQRLPYDPEASRIVADLFADGSDNTDAF